MSKTQQKLPPALVAALTNAEGPSAEAQNKTGEVWLTLKELVKAAEISERTIRYYIQEGILPPPQGAGPASRYGLEHLTRLSLVRRFKAALLPLSQIKQLMDELSLEELERVANQFQTELAHRYPVVEDKMRADRRRSTLNLEELAPPHHPANDQELEVFRLPDETEASQAEPEQNLVTPTLPPDMEALSFAGRWNRITLAPGLELHYQENGPQDIGQGRERLARLVELAMRLYR